VSAEVPGGAAPPDPVAAGPVSVLQALVDALAGQRAALEQARYASLAGLTAEIERHYTALATWPGGMQALRDVTTALPDAERQALRAMLARVDADNRINGELIRVAMQRVAALHAFAAAGSVSGTYGGKGGPDAGSRLSRRA